MAPLARQKIIGLAGPPHGSRGITLGLHARPGDRKDRADDARTVHRLKPHVAEIGQAPVDDARDLRVDVGDGRPPIFLVSGGQKMLFKRNLFDHAFLVFPHASRRNADCSMGVYNRYPMQWYMAQCYKRHPTWAVQGGLSG
jgi:hypothetical protein